MKFSAAGMELLKRFEGFRNRVYLDVAGLPTIGYGHRLLHCDSFSNGIDEPQAANLLACDVRDAEQAVERMVKAPLTQGQFDALVDFTFNLGSGRLASSTLLKSTMPPSSCCAGTMPAGRKWPLSRPAARPRPNFGATPRRGSRQPLRASHTGCKNLTRGEGCQRADSGYGLFSTTTFASFPCSASAWKRL